MKTLVTILTCLSLVGCSTTAKKTTPTVKGWGTFDKPIKTEWLPGRDMKILEDVHYTDPTGYVWHAPEGSIINGASIPRAFWTVLGGPYEGPYREASVMHDVACDTRSEPWERVHYAFYTAMRARGVPEQQAKVMYAAVYRFGPRWNKLKINTHLTRTPTQTDVQKVETFVEKNDPTIATIESTESIPGKPHNQENTRTDNQVPRVESSRE